MGRTTPVIDTTVLDDVIRRGFPVLLQQAKGPLRPGDDMLRQQVKAAFAGIVLVYRSALNAKGAVFSGACPANSPEIPF